MAIFTIIEPTEEFFAWAKARYGFCHVGDLQPIAEGIENTNYRFCADGKHYVFTIFEMWDAAAVAYYAALMNCLAQAGLPVVSPLDNADAVGDWEGKPCLVVPFVQGDWKRHPTADNCYQMGNLMGRLHIATGGFVDHRPNPRGHHWRRQVGDKLRHLLDDGQQHLLDNALRRDADFSHIPLPAAACHCDLFRNNVLWNGDNIAAVIDFYFGGYDALIFDIAVCACDWCFEESAFSTEKLRMLMGGYMECRQLTELEKRMIPDALSVAATRFWISRCDDLHFPRQAAQLTPHDPQYFENILRAVPPPSTVSELIAEVA